MNGLKKLNKELSDKNDQYMDQIHELESSNRGIDTLRKQVDEYKVKNVKLETEKFEAISESQLKDHEVTRLNAELTTISQSKRNLEDELQSSREEIAALTEEARQNLSSSHSGEGEEGDGEGVYEVETVLSLREKLKRVERELIQSRAGGLGAVESNVITEEVAVLQTELEEGRRKLSMREEALLSAKKQLSDTQSELHKMTRAHEDLQQQSSSSMADKEQSKALKDQESRLFQTENTLRLLEETLQEKEVKYS
jgi:predicted  nucleic acid-binding Zn-ribbon protein